MDQQQLQQQQILENFTQWLVKNGAESGDPVAEQLGTEMKSQLGERRGSDFFEMFAHWAAEVGEGGDPMQLLMPPLRRRAGEFFKFWAENIGVYKQQQRTNLNDQLVSLFKQYLGGQGATDEQVRKLSEMMESDLNNDEPPLLIKVASNEEVLDVLKALVDTEDSSTRGEFFKAWVEYVRHLEEEKAKTLLKIKQCLQLPPVKSIVVITEGDDLNTLGVVMAYQNSDDGVWKVGVNVAFSNMEKVYHIDPRGEPPIRALTVGSQVAVLIDGGNEADRGDWFTATVVEPGCGVDDDAAFVGCRVAPDGGDLMGNKTQYSLPVDGEGALGVPIWRGDEIALQIVVRGGGGKRKKRKTRKGLRKKTKTHRRRNKGKTKRRRRRRKKRTRCRKR